MHRSPSILSLSGRRLQRGAAWVGIVLLLGGPATTDAMAAEWFVDAKNGANGNPGTAAAAPWKTLSRAIADPRLQPGDVIHVDPGLYDKALGETFPLALIDGVEIVADHGPAATQIVAPVGGEVFLNRNTALGPATALRGFTLRHAGAGSKKSLMRFELGSVTMEPSISDNVLIGSFQKLSIGHLTTGADEPGGQLRRWRESSGEKGLAELGEQIGIHVLDSAGGRRSFSGTIAGNTFSELAAAVALSGSRAGTATHAPTVTGNTVAGGLVGMGFFASGAFAGELSPTVTGNTIDGVDYVGLSFFLSQGGGGDVVARPILSNNSITGGAVGIWVSASTAQATGSTTFEAAVDDNRLQQVGSGIVLAIDALGASGVELDWQVAARNNTVVALGDLGTAEIAVAGIQLRAEARGAAALAATTSIAGNTIDLSAVPAADSGSGILVDAGSFSGAGAASLETIVTGNTVSGALAGIWGLVSGLSGDRHDQVATTIEGNRVHGGAAGLAASTFDDAAAAVSTRLIGNTVTGATTGMWVSASSLDTARGAVSVEVRDNLLRDNREHGMAFALAPAAEVVPRVSCNTVTANGGTGTAPAGIMISANGGGAADLGGGLAGSPGRNAIFANGGVELRNRGPRPVKAEGGWWGATNATDIDGRILDDDEDSSRGAVDFSPFLSQAPTSAQTAEMVTGSGSLEGPAGAEPTAIFTATFSATGDCGCANPRVRAIVPEGATVLSASASRGVVTDAEGSDGLLDFALGSLAPGEVATVTYEILPPPGGCEVASRARLTCDHTTESVVTATRRQPAAAPDLSLDKEVDLELATAGDPLRYTILVENLDPHCAAVGARLRDTLPDAFRDASFACAAGPGSACGRPRGSGDLDERIEVAPGGTVSFTVDGVIFPGFVGELLNDAVVEYAADPVSDNDRAAAATVVVAPLGDLFPAEIPTLGDWVLRLFALGLGLLGWHRLRRRPLVAPGGESTT